MNEIFYSLQGEGRYTGTPAIFVRLAGCNLRCSFCDTEFQSGCELSEHEILEAISIYPARHVVITGGEPTLQLNSMLLRLLHEAGKFVQIETNGTLPLQDEILKAIDWITCSPKHQPVRIQRIDELKLVYQSETQMEEFFRSENGQLQPAHADCRYLQPCDTGDAERNACILSETISYIESHPVWRLSLQTHKLLGVR